VRLLLVDGYNILRAGALYGDLVRRDLQAARARLVDDLAAVTQGEYETIIVFDGAGNPHSDGASHHVAGVTVVFSPFGVEADTIIERRAQQAREHGVPVVVATSDATTQWTVLGDGVTRMSALELTSQLREDTQEMSGHAASGDLKGTISERIDSDVRRKLDEWARA